MQDPVETARRILARHPAPALPYTELHHLVSLETSGPAPSRERLFRRIRTRTEVFRILDPGRGPWRLLARRGSHPSSGSTRRTGRTAIREGSSLPDRSFRPGRGSRPDGGSLPEGSPTPDWLRPWVLLAASQGPGEIPGPGVSFPRVRTSVLSLARTLDDASTPSLTRWLLVAREERALRARIVAERSPI